MAQRAETEAAQQAAQNRFFAQGGVAGAPVSVQDGGFAAGTAPVSMPGATQFPGGLSAQDWNAVTSIGNVNPEAGMSFFTSLVEQRNKEKEGGFEGSKNLEGVFDSKGNFFRAYVRTDGTIQRPEGAVGELRFASPQEINAQKATGTVEGRMAGESRGGAPAAITAADKTINLIDKILADPALPNVVGDFQGRFDDPSFIRLQAGESGVATVNRINQLKAKGFIQAINSTDIKGALSDAEGMKLDSAENALSRVMSEESFREEMLAYRDIAERAKQRQALIESGKPEAEARAEVPESPFVEGTSPTVQQQAPNASGIAVIQSETEYNALPSGTVFQAPDGSVRTKP
jgi:hypothetical protein